MQRLWHAATLRALDQATIAAGLAGAALMECAGAAAAEVIRERFGGAWRIVVVCGPGNNGGDGFVVARRLVADSFAASVALTAPETAYAGDAAAMLRAADAAGVPRSELTDAGDADLVVDAVFGTGFRDALEVLPFETDAPIVALDVPSGIDATSGVVRGEAVRAEITVCFGGRKLGTAIEPGRSHSGEVVTVPIGLIESLAPSGARRPAVHGRGSRAARSARPGRLEVRRRQRARRRGLGGHARGGIARRSCRACAPARGSCASSPARPSGRSWPGTCPRRW